MPLGEALVRNRKGDPRFLFRGKGHDGLNRVGLALSRLGKEPNPDIAVQTINRDLFYPSGRHLAVRITHNIRAHSLEEAAQLTRLTEVEQVQHMESIDRYISHISTSKRKDLARTAYSVMKGGWHQAWKDTVPEGVEMDKVQRFEVYTPDNQVSFHSTLRCIFDFADSDKYFPDDPSYLFPANAAEGQELRYVRYILRGKDGEYKERNGVKYTLNFGNGITCDIVQYPLFNPKVVQPDDILAVQLLIKQGMIPVDSMGEPLQLPV